MNKKTKILLSIMIVSLSALVVPPRRHNDIIEASIRTQEEKTEIITCPFKGISKTTFELLEDTLQPSIVERENDELYVPHNINKYEIINTKVNATIIDMDEEMTGIATISDNKEYFIAYKEIVDKYSYIIDPPETIYDCFTEDELNMFFRVVQAEIGDEYSFDQKCNVASVILNRIDHYKFSDKMFEILTPDQFETINNKRYKNVKISEDAVLACEYVFVFGDTTNGALFFDSNNTLKYNFLFNDGTHNFYGLIEEQKKWTQN